MHGPQASCCSLSAGNFEEALPEEDVVEEPAEQSVDQSEERELAMLVAEVQSEEAQS